MHIGAVAERAGVPAKTIRYYEQIGLLPRPARGKNGYRSYDGRAIHELSFVRRARDLGFALEDVARLLALWRDERRGSAEVRALALEHVAAVERKLTELESLRATLLDLVHRCHGDSRPDCPILEDLERGPRAASPGTALGASPGAHAVGRGRRAAKTHQCGPEAPRSQPWKPRSRSRE
ncbi:MAG: Cu(I)-responsive transcriptional regulator [Myxococcales bacterium]|nr:Cu(I)-responsive transcriptional regulator [Myxococcales bacterium]